MPPSHLSKTLVIARSALTTKQSTVIPGLTRNLYKFLDRHAIRQLADARDDKKREIEADDLSSCIISLTRKEVNHVVYSSGPGQGVVEHTLTIILVAIVVIVILALLGPAIVNVFWSIAARF